MLSSLLSKKISRLVPVIPFCRSALSKYPRNCFSSSGRTSFQLLFFLQLDAVSRRIFPQLTMISRCKPAPFKSAFLAVAPVPFEKQLQTFSPAQPAYGFSISCQNPPLPMINHQFQCSMPSHRWSFESDRCLHPSASLGRTAPRCPRNGRHITDDADLESRCLQTPQRRLPDRSPALDIEPPPPDPMFLAFFTASSAAICAAKGVLFRDPLKIPASRRMPMQSHSRSGRLRSRSCCWEGRLNMRHPLEIYFSFPSFFPVFLTGFGHCSSGSVRSLFLLACNRPSWSLPCSGVRAGSLSPDGSPFPCRKPR